MVKQETREDDTEEIHTTGLTKKAEHLGQSGLKLAKCLLVQTQITFYL